MSDDPFDSRRPFKLRPELYRPTLAYSDPADIWPTPRARTSDPDTSVLAARSIGPANRTLVGAIRAALADLGPLTQEQIATNVERREPGRWRAGSIVSACARANLRAVSETTNERGRTVKVWAAER